MSEEEKVIEIRNRKYYSQYYVNQLQQENKKYKEVIDKAIEYIEKFIPIDEDTILMRERQRNYLLDILKGVIYEK